jgi:hypothetical protein
VLLGAAGATLTLGSLAAGAFWNAGLIVYAMAALGKTLALGRGAGTGIGTGRALLYLVLWPGLDPDLAFARDPRADRARGARAAALGALEAGAAVVLAAVSLRTGVLDWPEPLPSWARAGAFLAFLDGGFRCVAGVERALGWRGEDVFREPVALSDLADFWGRRWNRFVSRTLAIEVYGPAKRRAGQAAGTLAAFLASGVAHEAIFVVPGGRPFGLYLAFFGVHGVAVLATVAALARAPRGPGTLWAARGAAWAVLLATAPLFFGPPYREVFPLERYLPLP